MMSWNQEDTNNEVGVGLCSTAKTTIEVDPKGGQARALRYWYDHGNYARIPLSKPNFALRDRISLHEAKQLPVSSDRNKIFFSTRATVRYLPPERMVYPACNSGGRCQKKAIECKDGWMCRTCKGMFVDPVYRFV